jgi:PAS domain S-box-containing protein
MRVPCTPPGGETRRRRRMTLRRRLALGAAVTLMAGALGYSLNLGFPSSLSHAWPGRAITLTVAVLFGPWWGGLAALIGTWPAAAPQPWLFTLFVIESVVLGAAVKRFQSSLAPRGVVAGLLAGSVVLFPEVHGLPALEWSTAAIVFERLLVLLVAPVTSDLIVAALSTVAGRWLGHVPSQRPLRALIFHAFVLAATLPILVVSTVSGEYFAAWRQDEVSARLNDAAFSLADRLNSYVELHLSGVATIAALVELTPDSASRTALLEKQALIYPDFSALAIADAAGQIQQIQPAALMGPGGLSITDRPFFVDAVTRRHATISDVSTSPATGQPLVFLGVPVIGADGIVSDVAHGSLRLTAFQSFVESDLTLPDTSVVLLDRANRVVYASAGLGHRNGDDLTQSPMVRAGRDLVTHTFVYEPGRRPQDATQLAARATVPAPGWTVYVQQPRLAVVSGVQAYFLVTLGLVLAALIGSAIGARYFAATVTAPLEELVDFVRRLSIGTAEAAPLSANAPAEIAALTRDVNGMQRRVRESYAQLEKALADGEAANRSLGHLAEVLEEKVGQRTAELTTTTQFLENVLSALPGALFVADEHGLIQLCNEAASTLVGRTVSELMGSPLSAVFEADLGAATAESPIVRAERTLLTATGERVPVFVSSASIATVNVAARGGAVFIAIDIRDRKQLEMELHQAQKLESVGRLAAGVAHEINTPAQFVSDSVQFLKDGMSGLLGLVATYRSLHRAVMTGASTHEAALEVVRAEHDADLDYLIENVPSAIDRSIDGLGRVTAIVKSMKDFAHPDRKEMVAVDLNHGIQSTLNITRNEFKYVADLQTDFGPLPPVICHGGDINQVVLNIVVNAAHAIGDVVGATGRRGLISVETRVDGSFVLIRISDTGTGIPEAIRDRVFDPFFTTKDVGKGTGQGLAIARAIVIDKHRGQFSFETELGLGTSFTIRLPIDGPRAASEAAA